MIKAVIFDAFGTLFQVTSGASAQRIINNITASGACVDGQAFIRAWKEYYKLHTAANMPFETERNIFISRIRMFYDRYNVKRNAEMDADALLADAYDRDVYAEVPAALNALRDRYKIYIGSNTDNDVLHAVMKKNNITVDKTYTSENLKCYKPAPAFYRTILRENGLPPHEAVFVGDSLDDDILGPRQVGMKTVLVDRQRRYGPNVLADAVLDHVPDMLNFR